MPKKDLWTYLSETEKKIVMYGMGNGADKIISICERYGIEICDFFASDGFVRGHTFHGKRVLSLPNGIERIEQHPEQVKPEQGKTRKDDKLVFFLRDEGI